MGVGKEKPLILRAIQRGAAVVPVVMGDRARVKEFCHEFEPFLSVQMSTEHWQGRPFAELMRRLYDAANPFDYSGVA